MAHTHTLLWSSFERAAIISASNPIPNPNPNQVDISWNTFITQGVGPLCTRQRTRGCERRAQTLGDMLHRAAYFTGFVGKWHVSSPAAGVQAFFRGTNPNPDRNPKRNRNPNPSPNPNP